MNPSFRPSLQPLTHRRVLYVVIGFWLLACGASPRSLSTAPPFTLKDLSGKSVALASFRGKPIFIDFWATWCPPCRESIPRVQQIHRDFKDKGLVVLGISVDEDKREVLEFVRQRRIEYPILLGGNSEVSEAYDVLGIPTFILVTADGRIHKRYSGFSDRLDKIWRTEINKLLTG